MRYRTLGVSGIEVSELGFGAMNFGVQGGPSEDEAAAMVRRALDAGINLIDTADVYTLGESERVVGRAIKGHRDEVVLATKFGLPMSEEPNQRAGRPAGSGRWRTASGGWTPTTSTCTRCTARTTGPPDDTLAALSDLVQAGKVRASGRPPSRPS